MSAIGPHPFTHDERFANAHEIATELQNRFGKDLLALGLYGSLARGTDGPYSDIEMWCVVCGEGIDYAYEWTVGPWKAEVDVRSQDQILKEAAELDGSWAMTHGAFAQILPFYDPENFFPTLKDLVFDHSDEEFEAIIRAVIVGEIYEIMGKIRNQATETQNRLPHMLPFYLMSLARYGAWLVGLANRKLYSTTSNMFIESLAFSKQPAGYESLCRLGMSGELREPARLLEVAEEFWEGVVAWASQNGLRIEQSLSELLRK